MNDIIMNMNFYCSQREQVEVGLVRMLRNLGTCPPVLYRCSTHRAYSGLDGALGPQACVLYSAEHLKETILHYQP